MKCFLVLKQQIEDHSSEINERCNDMLRIQTALKSREEELELTLNSLRSEIDRLGEETRSLNKRLTSAQKQNDSLLKKDSKLSEQMGELRDNMAANDAMLFDKTQALVLRDSTIAELENQISEHKLAISNLKEQATRLLSISYIPAS